MSTFLTFTLVNLKHQLIDLARQMEAHPHKREELLKIRDAIELAMKNAILRSRAEAESPNAIKH